MNNNDMKYLIGLKEKIDEKSKEESELNGRLKQLKSEMKVLGIKSIEQLDKKRDVLREEIKEINSELVEIYYNVKEKLA